MEYDSRPRNKLFELKDKEGETKELFFIGRKVMAGIGILAGFIVTSIIYFTSENLLISAGIGIAVGLPMSVFPVIMDKNKEAYFTPLIMKLIELLHEHGIDVAKENIMDLLSFKELRITSENVLSLEVKEGKITVYLVSDIKPEKVKVKKPKTFPVVVIDANETNAEKQTEPEAVVEIAPEDHPIHEEEELTAGSAEEENTEKKPVGISSFSSSGASYSAVSTHAIDIVSPTPESTVPTIGYIAPGMTGPIPVTVGDRSIIHEEDRSVKAKNLGSHAEPYSEPPQASPRVSKGKHGRRSAAQ